MRERRRRFWVQSSATCFVVAAALACASERAADAPPVASSAASSAEAEDARIVDIEAAIGRDRAALRRFVSEQGGNPGVTPLHANREVQEIARRLPALQQELRELRRARATRAAPLQAN
jgi:hypothetical protein